MQRSDGEKAKRQELSRGIQKIPNNQSILGSNSSTASLLTKWRQKNQKIYNPQQQSRIQKTQAEPRAVINERIGPTTIKFHGATVKCSTPQEGVALSELLPS